MADRKRPNEPEPPAVESVPPIDQDLQSAMLLYQVLDALSRYHTQYGGEPAVTILVPTGKAESVRQLDIEKASKQFQLPVLQGLSLQEITRLSDSWKALVEQVPVIESEEVQQIIIVTVTMDLISRLHERYLQLGLKELIERRGIPFDQLAICDLYTKLLTTLFALDLYTELISRTPKLVIPTGANLSVPPGNS